MRTLAPALVLLVACSSGGTSVINPPAAAIASVTVTIPTNPLVVGQAEVPIVVLKDADGNVLLPRAVAWASSQISVATVRSGGTINALAPGLTSISASVNGLTGSAALSVIQAAGTAIAAGQPGP